MCLVEKLSPLLLSALEEDSMMARQFACRSFSSILKLIGRSLHPEALNKIYPGKWWLFVQFTTGKFLPSLVTCYISKYCWQEIFFLSGMCLSFLHRAAQTAGWQQRASAQLCVSGRRPVAVQSDRRIQPQALRCSPAVPLPAAPSVPRWSWQLCTEPSARWAWVKEGWTARVKEGHVLSLYPR